MDHDRPRKNLVLGPPKEGQGLSCTSCAALCPSMHQPVSLECHPGCSICADFAKINDEIASTYRRLFDLVAERQKFVTNKARHNTSMHRMPVEVLSLIFVFVREVVLDLKSEDHPDYRVPKPPFRQPSTSPPLLVGAVCRRWREISMTTPQLWTDITIGLEKEGQVNMVQDWGRRSGPLPLDIVVFTQNFSRFPGDTRRSIRGTPKHFDVLYALRSLARRWNNLTLYTPGYIWHILLDNLEDTPLIDLLFLFNGKWDIGQINLEHPFRPRRLVSDVFHGKAIPFEWDRLEFLKHDSASSDDLLNIIQRARNLRHCVLGDKYPNIRINPITHHYIISFVSLGHSRIIQNLTLPSLQQLDYAMGNEGDLDTLVEFLDRSRAPLNTLTVRYNVSLDKPFLHIERLCGITSLFLEVFYFGINIVLDSAKIETFLSLLLPSPTESLSRLKNITFQLCDLNESSWSDLSYMFDDTSNSGTPVIPEHYLPTRKLSGICVPLSDDIKAAMKRRPFLRLLEVKQIAGIDISIQDRGGTDVLIL